MTEMDMSYIKMGSNFNRNSMDTRFVYFTCPTHCAIVWHWEYLSPVMFFFGLWDCEKYSEQNPNLVYNIEGPLFVNQKLEKYKTAHRTLNTSFVS